LTWIVARQPGLLGVLCPDQNQPLSVCQRPAAAGLQKDSDDD
jgi:hypothetical protein